MEKAFEELIERLKRYSTFWMFEPNADGLNAAFERELIEYGKQVREATEEEFSQALLGVTLPGTVVKKIGKIISTPDRILITENEE